MSKGGRRVMGPKRLMERVDVIESLQPEKPKNPETGEEMPYHSECNRHREELIDICRALRRKPPLPPDVVALKNTIAELKYELRYTKQNHCQVKRSNEKLRVELSTLKSPPGPGVRTRVIQEPA